LIEKCARIGAHLLQTEMAQTRIEAGGVHGLSGAVTIRTKIAYARECCARSCCRRMIRCWT